MMKYCWIGIAVKLADLSSSPSEYQQTSQSDICVENDVDSQRILKKITRINAEFLAILFKHRVSFFRLSTK